MESAVIASAPSEFRLAVGLILMVADVVNQERPLVVDVVIAADDGVFHLLRERYAGHVIVRASNVRRRKNARGEVSNPVGIEQLLRNHVRSGNACPGTRPMWLQLVEVVVRGERDVWNHQAGNLLSTSVCGEHIREDRLRRRRS